MNGWIAGGANGVNTTNTLNANSGVLPADTYLYIGGTTKVESTSNTNINSSPGGNVFGAGVGRQALVNAGNAGGNTGRVNTSYVSISDECEVEHNVYAGGNFGYNNIGGNVFITGGTVHGSVFGGANQNRGVNSNIIMTDGFVEGGIYGGSNATGTLSGNVTMNINGGQVGTASQTANIHGGGYGQNTAVNGNVDLTLGASGQTEGGVTVYGDVYGGSADGSVNDANNDHTYVTLNAGTIYGSLYGGGLGITNANCNVNGAVKVEVNGGSVKKPASGDNPASIFGCNNAMGSPKSTVEVVVNKTDETVVDGSGNKTYAINGVYGGGNLAHYNPTTPGNYPTVTINGCESSIKDVYGGGNAAAVPYTSVTIKGGDIDRAFAGGNGESGTPAHVGYMNTDATPTGNVYGSGTASIAINGGTINQVFGGSNANGTIRVSSSININKSGDCKMMIGEVYRGGNEASGALASIDIGCTGDIVEGADGHAAHPENIGKTLEGIGDLYGGSRKADNTGAVTLNITSGIINRVFGGNNISGNVAGDIQVNINKTGDGCGWYVGDVFGGGNLAAYTGSPAVNVLNGTVSHNVYGGGKGDPDDHTKGQVTGNPVVTIGDADASRLSDNNVVAVVTGDVYGGGDAGNVEGTPQVNVINKCNTSIGNVYGGGNAADVKGTDVNIDGGTITGMVFGGGHGDKNSNPQKQADVNGNVAVDVTGGTINKVFGGSNSKGNISGTVAVNIEKGANSCDMKINEVYGGGNEAAGNAGSLTIGCTGDYESNGEGIKDVYGGANAADINNDISLIIKGGHIDRVFGGNNSSGNISGTVAVEVNWDNSLTCDKYLGNVFGGGNLATYSGAPTVTLTNGTVSHSVYGGGNEAGVGGSLVNINGGTVIDGVYGGCNTSGDVSGNIVVNINGGTLGTATTPLTSGIFGGGFGEATTTGGNVTVNIGDPAAASAAATSTIYGDIYGGSALGTVNDAVSDVTTVNFNNGTIHGNIYGGGLGAATLNSNGYIESVTTEAIVNGTVHVNIGTETQTSNFVTINGQVFGCNNLAGTPKGPVYVDVYKTAHTEANIYPTPEPTKAVDVTAQPSSAFAISAVYGGGNLAHYTTTTENAATHVTIHGCDNTIEYVYGGGNAASSPATDVIVEGGRFNYIFGGGNGAGEGNPGANIVGDAKATISGGLVYRAFGGSNTRGTIGGTSGVDLPDATTCTRLVHEIFGGGNEAPGGSVDMVIPCGTTGTGIIYAGANNADMGTEADFNDGRPVLIKLTVQGGDFIQVFGGNNQGGTIWGNVELHLQGGTIENAFGGNNLGGDIKGWIKVYVEDAESTTCPLILTNVYGGGYNAAYTPVNPTQESPVVYVNHIKSGNKILGNVFGGGYGQPATVTANPVVYIGNTETGHDSDIATIAGNVYGGGELAKVAGSTEVLILKDNSVIEGTVYGGGKGSETDIADGLVTVNTKVELQKGHVHRSIYGGGELGSVGTFESYYAAGESTDHIEGEPKTCKAGTGKTEVIISGGLVGLNQQHMPDPNDPTSDDDYGYIFCASKGLNSGDDIANKLAVSNTSHLLISGGLVIASVYGGSENGQVMDSTLVEITGGQIGTGHYKVGDEHHWDDVYAESDWNDAIAAVKSSDLTIISNIAAKFHECDAWPFNPEGSRYIYDYFAQYEQDGEYYYDENHTQLSNHGSNQAGNGHSFFGNVFGGGSGYYPYAPGQWRRTAGRVCGNTYVKITGGHILNNVYGGNEITDVIGKSTVEMSGGTVGVPRTNDAIQAHPVNSYIFGAGMGDPRTMFFDRGNVGSALVNVKGDAVVFGSVFGGGEDGHVLGNAETNITGNALIGTFGTSGVDGNIFGSGRGFSALALSAGVVCGNVTVNIKDNVKILGSVFGGGRLAAVGTYLAEENSTDYGAMQEGTAHGNVTVNITGGTIGNQNAMSSHEYSVGDVFGGSKGILMGDWNKDQKLGLVKNTTVNISEVDGATTTIYGNVYGGGEIASVGSYEYATAADTTTYNATHKTEPMDVGDVKSLAEAGSGVATINIDGGTIGQNSLSDTHGLVFGGCLGRAGTGYSGYSYVDKSFVTLNGADAHVYGSVFGGGENGHVLHDTDVKIQQGYVGIQLDNIATGTLEEEVRERLIYRGNVYGGGRGIDTYNDGTTDHYSITAGKVTGNTKVTISGGQIYRNVYGGGSLASVGDPDENTNGNATIIITGGQIGTDGGYHNSGYYTPSGESVAKPVNHLLENGHVFGSGRGVAGGSDSDFIRLAYVKNTYVTIGGTAYVTGSVFGSGENGHVRQDTHVTINPGEGTFENNGIEPYPIIGYPLTQAEMVESPIEPVMIYRGNVYGGGRGIDHTTSNHLSESAGCVKGNTNVTINGGTIRHNVYGGGSLASTGDLTDNDGVITYHDNTGLATINISGGRIGMSPELDICKTTDGTLSGFNNGQVYGGARGVAAGPGHTEDSVESEYVHMAYVHDTKVNIGGTAKVFGSVFGGGANGHVNNDTEINISGGEIGTDPAFLTGTADPTQHFYFMNPETGEDGHIIYTGNVYGGGRGIDHNEEGELSATAGRVFGNTEVNITGGQIWHNVYGGGSLASVGTFTKDGDVYTFTDDTGIARVNISGGTVGFEDFKMDEYLTFMGSHPGEAANMRDFTQSRFNNGRVFGSGRGMAGTDYAPYAYVNESHVTITGGDVKGSVFGSGENGHVKGDTYVNIEGGTIGYKIPSFYLGNVYGSGRGVDLDNGAVSVTAGRTEGNTNVTVTGGKIYRDVYGGGSLASVGLPDDNTTGLATVLIDTGAEVGDPFCVANGFGGNVFGSGRGMPSTTDIDYSAMAYVKNTDVIIKGHPLGNVYGGGNDGHVRQGTHVTLDGGTVGLSYTTQMDTDNNTNFAGNIYGGNIYGAGKGVSTSDTNYSQTAGIVRGNVVVDIKSGETLNDVYGGAALAMSNSNPSAYSTTVNLMGGTIRSAYGGGQGDATTAALVYGNTAVFLNGSTETGATNDCKVKGNIFGCNNINGTPKGHALVHVYKTVGYDATHTKSTDKDNTTYDVAAVYGGGNMAAYDPSSPTDSAEVIIDGCDDTSIEYVYGGGNAASVPATVVKVYGTYEIGNVFGGGNGKDQVSYDGGTTYVDNPGADVGLKGGISYGTGKADVYLHGGTIHNAFGGSNTKGSVAKKAEVHMDELKENGAAICPLVIDEVYGGGNEAYMAGGVGIDLGCITYLKTIYGGAKKADIDGDINLTITSGHFDRVFGGNNLGGNIKGSITVNIEETGCHPITIGELYGCGNQAAYSIYGYENTGTDAEPEWKPLESGTMPEGMTHPTLNVKSFTSIGRIFGGGLGETAKVVGNPTVYIDEVVGDRVNEPSTYAGKTRTLPDGTTVTLPAQVAEKTKIGTIGTVYGGGNAAPVVGDTNVNIGTKESITYVSGDKSTKRVKGVNIENDVFGGGLGETAKVSGNTNVVVGGKKS